jgi:hypothetical protein
MDEQPSIYSVVAATLKEIGIRLAPMWTALIQKGYFVGHKYRFDGGYAVSLIEKHAIEIYDDEGKLLKTVSLEETDKKTAA